MIKAGSTPTARRDCTFSASKPVVHLSGLARQEQAVPEYSLGRALNDGLAQEAGIRSLLGGAREGTV